MTDLTGLFDDHQMFHSDFQIDCFILGSGGTTYGRYKQCLREVVKRWRSLKTSHISRERLKLELELLATCTTTGERNRRINDLDCMEKRMQLEEIDRQMADTLREFNRFYAHATMLKEEVGELDPPKRKLLDEEMWEHKMKERAAIDWMTKRTISEPAINMLHSFPPAKRAELMVLMTEKPRELVDWFEKQSTHMELPAPNSSLTLETVLCLTDK